MSSRKACFARRSFCLVEHRSHTGIGDGDVGTRSLFLSVRVWCSSANEFITRSIDTFYHLVYTRPRSSSRTARRVKRIMFHHKAIYMTFHYDYHHRMASKKWHKMKFISERPESQWRGGNWMKVSAHFLPDVKEKKNPQLNPLAKTVRTHTDVGSKKENESNKRAKAIISNFSPIHTPAAYLWKGIHRATFLELRCQRIKEKRGSTQVS